MISETLQNARDYENKYGVFIQKEERPVFHATPKVGWMNDPNGFSVYQGKYHLFFQSHPYSNQWGPMHWGHVISEDFLHWSYLPTAIAPDMLYDKAGCFSGSALETKDGKHLLLYTGVRQEKKEDGTMCDIQTQCVAIGDGIDYQKFDKNPVLDVKDIPEGFSEKHFRDPKIFQNADGSYGCVVGNLTEDNSGAILLFHSEDGFHWNFETVLDRSCNEYGKMWECPDFFELDGKQVMILSPQNMYATGLEFHNGHCTLAFLGQLSEDGKKFCRQEVQAIDYGLDFYAPQTLCALDGRRIMIGWMQNWETCIASEDAKYFGQMSIPRELSIRNNRLIQNPIRELSKFYTNPVIYNNVMVKEEVSLQGVSGRVLDMTVTIKALSKKYDTFCMEFAKGNGAYSFITYCPKTSILCMSRTYSHSFDRDIINERECLVRNQDGNIKIRLILDKFSAELFVNDGEQALTMTLFTEQTADHIVFRCDEQISLSVEKHDIVMEG